MVLKELIMTEGVLVMKELIMTVSSLRGCPGYEGIDI